MLIKAIHLIVLIPATALLLFQCSPSGPDKAVYTNPDKPVDERVKDLLTRMTTEEKAGFLSGKDMWHLKGLERLGIPSIQVTDCGHGITVILNGPNCATAFPTGVGQAAMWDKDLEYKIGKAIAQEARALGSAILLAPMINIHRTPLNGRNYESFSEDPFLTGKMAAAFINGVQSQNIGACIKAAVANNQQTDQGHLDVQVSERALREIYLKGFEMAIKESDPWALMTSYNMLNGYYTAANSHLIRDIIKNTWNYKGFVVSDWRGVHSKKSITAGLDLEMPGPGKYLNREGILEALKTGMIREEELNDRVGRILRAIEKSRLPDNPGPGLTGEWNTPAHHKLAYEAAAASIVLLKNTGGLLPLDKGKLKKIAVIGPNALEARLGGGGSASVTACSTISPMEGLKNVCGDQVQWLYEEGARLNGSYPVVRSKYLFTNTGGKQYNGLLGEYFNNSTLSGTPDLIRVDPQIDFSWGWASPGEGIKKNAYSVRWTGKLKPPATGTYQIGVSGKESGVRMFVDDRKVIDRWGNPGKESFEEQLVSYSETVKMDLEAGRLYNIRIEFHKKHNKNTIRFEWEIPGSGNMYEQAVRLAGGCDAAIIFAGLSNLYEGGNNDRKSLHLPGEQDRLIRGVSRENPNTVVVLINGSPVAMPWLSDVKSVIEAYYPGQEGGNAIAGVLFGEINPCGKLPETFPVKLEDNPSYGHYPGNGHEVEYAEGIYVGYRHYDTQGIDPLFPFGHGLSYTRFKYSNIQAEIANDEQVTVSCLVKNTGEVPGAEVVQLYIKDVGASVGRPEKELKGFEKIPLRPGEEKRVEFRLQKEAFAFWDPEKNGWVTEPGAFRILIGSSSRDIRLTQTINLNWQ